MKRDMELCRKILFEIEKQYVDVAIHDLKIPGYTMQQVAYHCELLEKAGLVASYKPFYADDGLYYFSVGALTWEGHDFLDKIREDTWWNKTKKLIAEKGLPMTVDVIKTVATALLETAMKNTLNMP